MTDVGSPLRGHGLSSNREPTSNNAAFGNETTEPSPVAVNGRTVCDISDNVPPMDVVSHAEPDDLPSPVQLRKRKPPLLNSAFDPSRCPQCGTGSMCSRCKSSLEREKEKEKAVSLLVPVTGTVTHTTPNLPKKSVEVGKNSTAMPDHSAERPTGTKKPKDKKKASARKAHKLTIPKPLAGAAAQSHAERLNRLLAGQMDEHDLSAPSKMFEFIERFMESCPTDKIDSFVRMKPGEIQMTGLGNLTYRQLAQHVFGLRVEHVQRLVRPVMHRLLVHPKNMEMFNQPVDPEALGIPTYFEKIKNPMDLGTVKGKLQRGGYQNLDDCVAEISLVFDNAMCFNPPGHIVHEAARILKNDFFAELSSLKEKLDKEAERKMHHACTLCQGFCCFLCGEKCLRVEPPILVCHGTCGQKIKKNCIYYVSRDGFMLWCQKCHSGLPSVAAEARGIGKRMILKKDLLKRRLDEEVAESWVRCDTCQRWVHQVCGLFNERYEALSTADLALCSGSTSGAIKSDAGTDLEHNNYGTCGNGCFECPLCKLKDAIGERIFVKPPSPTPPPSPELFLPPPDAPHVEPIAGPEIVAPPVEITTMSLHGRARKIPTVLSGGDFIVIPLKQAHVSRAPLLGPDGEVQAPKAKKRGRPEGSVNKQKSRGAVGKKGLKNVAIGGPIKKLKLSKGDILPADIAAPINYFPKFQGRRGRKPKFRVNLGRPEEFNTNLGFDEDLLANSQSGSDKVISHEDCTVHSDLNRGHVSQSDNTLIASIHSKKNQMVIENDKNEALIEKNGQGETDSVMDIDKSDVESVVEDPAILDDTENSTSNANSNSEKLSVLSSSDAEDSDQELKSVNADMVIKSGAGERMDNEDTVLVKSGNMMIPLIQKASVTSLNDILRDVGHRQWTAGGLPKTHLGDFLETLVRCRLKETEKHSKVAESVYVRLISNTTHKLEVPAQLRDNFPNADGYILPRFIPYRQKCIILFQRIQGNDICLFCLYVQEFDENCPEPNRSRVYIAYLDSIEYFRPRECRTLVYHEILVGYLKWAQGRGFQHCHIWACPPQRGDNFIFWCHPPHQRTPSRDRLTSWYNHMLRRASALNTFSKEGLKDAWSVFFRQYGGRENTSESRTSGRPVTYYSGGREAKAKRGRGGRRGTIRGGISFRLQDATNLEMPTGDDETGDAISSSEVVPLSRTASMDSVNAISENGKSKIRLVQPVCPPIFEGDFWVNECIRIHKFMEGRIKAAAAGLDAANAVISAGPMADKAGNQRAARDIIKKIVSKPLAYPFLLPVDPVALGIPDYVNIVKNPMDLGTIKGKLKAKNYLTMFDFAEDVRLTFANSILYNPLTHPIHTAASDFLDMFTAFMKDFVSSKLGPNLTPVPDETTGGLDIWLKKFMMPGNQIGFTETVQNLPASGDETRFTTVSSGVSNLLDEPKDSCIPDNSLGDAMSAVLENGESSIGHSLGIARNEDGGVSDEKDPVSNGEDGDDGSSRSSSDSDEEADIEKDEEFGNEDLVKEMKDGEETDELDGPVYYGSNMDRDNTHSPRSYPAPAGFCRQDSAVDLFVSDKATEDDTNHALRTSTALMVSAGMLCIKQENSHSSEPKGELFQGAALGMKGVCSLMHELSKASLRFKDDLFVIQLSASPLQERSLAVGDNFATTENPSDKTKLWSDWLQASNLDADVLLPLVNGVILSGNTADPDMLMPSPFVDSRHTFLEMCQYRHYQFDSIRRAKHSSMMLLYHLHHPSMSSLRPVCVACSSIIKNIRWHCELCDHYDLCAKCVAGKIGASHQHPLIPFRVTYV